MVTEDDCIHALREAAQLLGDSPTKAQYEDLGLTPSASTILRQCGGWNAAKRRAGLATNYSRGSRVEPKPDGVDLPEGLVWDELSQDQRWHYRNREWNTERSLQRRRRLRLWVNEQKQERGCRECGEDDPECLDFHHPVPAEKEMEVSTMITWGYGKDRLEPEIEKCTVLCANCHRKKHHEKPDGIEWANLSTCSFERIVSSKEATERPVDLRDRQQAWVYEYKRSHGCRDCVVENPACLDLHHTGDVPKSRSVSQLIADGCSWKELLREVQKCIVLCANCHRNEHYEGPVPE
ncbi:hypothetical protein BV210_08500 [Halorientalis sp. IM1011]|uniref:homing endonuclease associated repeat-containing protein n=1 Tax=Halorientalis sp. IM1011 TaxID=1932360 RepID=UPI00097CCFB2|nr:hypothetical protein [Halorientalis sp. IM1011]AQL42746.1 hypothetical protein BV210_08500 [Halorientalis sp. IM1011]